MKNIIIKGRMHIPGLHLLYDTIPELFSFQDHKIIAKFVPFHPLPVIYKKPCCFVGGVIGIKFILMKSFLTSSKITQKHKLKQKQNQKYCRCRYFKIFLLLIFICILNLYCIAIFIHLQKIAIHINLKFNTIQSLKILSYDLLAFLDQSKV